MNYIFIGEIVNTHGLKGELRIISDFNFKKDVFKKGQVLYVGKRKEKMVINTYRYHKIYDMVTLDGINDINDAIVFKGDKVYVDRDSLNVDGFLNEDIIGVSVYNEDSLIGSVESIMKSPRYDILVVTDKEKRNLIPFIDEFVVKVDLPNNRIDIKAIEGLLSEN